MPNLTTHYQLKKPIVNSVAEENQWGTYLNQSLDLVDSALNNLAQAVANVSTTSLSNSIENLQSDIQTNSSNISAVNTNLLNLKDGNTSLTISGISDELNNLSGRITTLSNTVDGIDTSGVASGVADGTITTVKIAAEAVTTAKIAGAAINEGKIAQGAVTTVKIVDGAITGPKIIDDAITGQKIADGAIDTTHIPSTHTIIPKPSTADAGKTLFYDGDTNSMIWRWQTGVTQVANYAAIFSTAGIEKGDVVVVNNGGIAGGIAANDYASSIGGVATPAELDANSVFLALSQTPGNPNQLLTLFTGSNGVTNVTTNQAGDQATFTLEDGTTYDVPLPVFQLNDLDLGTMETTDFLVFYDRSLGLQKKITAADFSSALNLAQGSIFATNAQGDLADTALQPGDNISQLTNNENYLTQTQVDQRIQNYTSQAGFLTSTDTNLAEGGGGGVNVIGAIVNMTINNSGHLVLNHTGNFTNLNTFINSENHLIFSL